MLADILIVSDDSIRIFAITPISEMHALQKFFERVSEVSSRW